MMRCLSERALLLFAVGEGSVADRDHCSQCPACAGRLRAVRADLDGIGRVLRDVPPPLVVRRPRRMSWWSFAPALGVAALVAVVGLQWLREGRPLARLGGEQGGDAHVSVSASAEEVLDAVFDTSIERSMLAMTLAPSASTRFMVTEASEIERALGLGSPCTGDPFVDADCSDYTSALFF